MTEPGPMHIVLTEEQRQIVHRMSGQFVDAIELEPAEPGASHGALKLRWRLSTATGIPRLAWSEDDEHEDERGPSQR